MSEFSKRLNELRKESGISQEVLAKRVGVTQQCVSGWEKDKIEPTLSNLISLADVFSVSIDYLAGRIEF